MHVLPKGFHRIRHYGLLASGTRAGNLTKARELIGAPPPKPDAGADAGARADDTSVDDSQARTCPCCSSPMRIIEIFERGTEPRHWPTSPAPPIRIDTS